MKTITIQFSTSVILALALVFSFAITPLTAAAHDGEDHSEEVQDETEMKRQLLIQIIGLLQQLIEQRSHAEEHVDEHDHTDYNDHTMDGGAELLISVETHGGVTHVHVDELGKDEVSFFLEDLDLSERAAIITAIALETGFSEAEVEAAAHFAEAEEHDEHAAEEEHDDHEEDTEDDLAGIHIMADGTVMLGSGEVVADATVNEDDMIVLADGTVVEPTMDLR